MNDIEGSTPCVLVIYNLHYKPALKLLKRKEWGKKKTKIIMF